MSEKDLFPLFMKCRSVCTDTRQLIPGSIFFALKGERFNGNEFAAQAIKAGCIATVIDEEHYLTSGPFILVDDVLNSLQRLATQYRQTLSFPVIGITGSNGKTTTKELMRDVLARRFRVSATKGNLNNHIGVPLTLLSIPPECEIAIVEMGANRRGEIKTLCEIAEPDYGLITNIGKAHLEGFGGLEGVKLGKKELYDYLAKHGGSVFVNADDPLLMELSEGMNRNIYGTQCAQFHTSITSESPFLEFELQPKEAQAITVKSKLTGAYNLHNLHAAIAVGLHFGVEADEIARAIEEYEPENNRSQLEHTARNTVILDAYNANPSSMAEALKNLSRQSAEKKLFIIGDMLELGEESEREHNSILELAEQLGLQGIVIGPHFTKVSGNFSLKAFESTSGALHYLQKHPITNHLLLLKGSRGMKLETLIPAL